MSARSVLYRLGRDESGATAVEYGFVLPVLALLILGGIWVGVLMFSISSLDLAVQSAARCMAVDANACGTPSATQAYAQSHYGGPNISAVFTASATGCGHTVIGQANYDLNILPGSASIPLKVSACYP